MFEPHFGLRENPFSTGHDPRFVYPSPEHLEAVAHFRYGIQNREAFVLVTGEVGTGKTTAIYDLVSRLPQQAHVALINNSALTRLELLEEIARRFGVEPPATPSKPALLSALELRLSAHNGKGEPCILIIDEAQNLSNDLLEEIRLLSNLDDRGGHLLHICLVGQPELEAKLARPELRQLRQRISVKYRLNPLSPEECVRYIHHRLRVAGGEPEGIFPEDSAYAVHRLTHGIPREINIVASQAMVNAFVESTRPVRPEHVRAVSDEFSFQSVLGAEIEPPRPAPSPAAPAPPPPAMPPSTPYDAARAVAPPRVAPMTPPPMPAPVGTTPMPPRTLAPPPPMPVPVMRPPAQAPPPGASDSPRTVSNWRERRSPAAPPPAITPPAPVPAAIAPTPVVVTPRPITPAPRPVEPVGPARVPAPVPTYIAGAPHNAAYDEPAELPGLDVEEARARRTQFLVVAISVVAIAIVTAVLWSTGLIGKKASPTPPVTANSSGVPAVSGAPPEPAAGAQPLATASAPAAPALEAGPVFGFQVAAFRTAGRATHVLKEMSDTTQLPGEILANEGDDGNTWYRIVLGRYPTESEAQSAAQDLIRRSLIPEAIIIPYTPREP